MAESDDFQTRKLVGYVESGKKAILILGKGVHGCRPAVDRSE